MTRAAALATIRTLAAGLQPDVAGVGRLLERIALLDQAEALRDVLVEQGAQALLDGEQGRPA